MRRTTRSFVVTLLAVLVAGTGTVGSSVPQPDRWRACGEWTAVPMPFVGYWTVMEDVAVVSPYDAWAVGFVERADRRHAITMHWDGWRWSVADAPDVRGWSSFSGVAATGPDDVWAVGTRWLGHQARGFALIRHWDGRRWRTVASPGSTATIQLHAVATVPRTDHAWAVGAVAPREHPEDGRGFTLRWDGGRWRRVPVPPVAGELYDVTAHGEGLWVVGADEHDRALTMRRADGRWHVVRAPGTDPLPVVASQPRGDVWAATYGGIYRRRDGRWRRVRTMEHAALLDLTFTSPTEAWVVGGEDSGGEWYLPFSMHRVRSSWTPVPLPAIEDTSAVVAADGTPHDVWAVGNPIGYGGPSTAYHYC